MPVHAIDQKYPVRVGHGFFYLILYLAHIHFNNENITGLFCFFPDELRRERP